MFFEAEFGMAVEMASEFDQFVILVEYTLAQRDCILCSEILSGSGIKPQRISSLVRLISAYVLIG